MVFKGFAYHIDSKKEAVLVVAAKCPSLTNPISGSVSTSTDGIVTKAAYSCSSVYEMIGESQLICLDTGAWDINPPKCGKHVLEKF